MELMQDVKPENEAGEVPDAAPPSERRRPGWVSDLAGVLWVVAAGIAALLPALMHGLHLGPFDILSKYPLTHQSGVTVHNPTSGDQIDAIMPWQTLAWRDVHNGQLPLWNPYGGTGLPLAFNWQSAAFGLPALVGYLLPVQYTFTAGVLVTLIVAGTGGYFFGRVLGLGVIGSAMAGTAFELSGPFMGWLGWPHSSVMSWAGWLFAFTVLIIRGKHVLRYVALFAVALALAVYAGQPEILILLACALAIFVAVMLIQVAISHGMASTGRSIVALGCGTIAGLALGAPLILPGLQVEQSAVRGTISETQILPYRNLIYFVFQGFDGLPFGGSHLLSPLNPFDGEYYSEYVAYIGVIALFLAVVAAVLRWRDKVTVALAAVAVIGVGIVFFPPLGSLMTRLPGVGQVEWHRALLFVTFAMAILAGIGIDALLRTHSDRAWWWTGGMFAVVAGVMAIGFVATVPQLPSLARSVRTRSFIWPSIDIILGIAAVGVALYWWRRHRIDQPGTLETGPRMLPRRFRLGGREPSCSLERQSSS